MKTKLDIQVGDRVKLSGAPDQPWGAFLLGLDWLTVTQVFHDSVWVAHEGNNSRPWKWHWDDPHLVQLADLVSGGYILIDRSRRKPADLSDPWRAGEESETRGYLDGHTGLRWL